MTYHSDQDERNWRAAQTDAPSQQYVTYLKEQNHNIDMELLSKRSLEEGTLIALERLNKIPKELNYLRKLITTAIVISLTHFIFIYVIMVMESI